MISIHSHPLSLLSVMVILFHSTRCSNRWCLKIRGGSWMLQIPNCSRTKVYDISRLIFVSIRTRCPNRHLKCWPDCRLSLSVPLFITDTALHSRRRSNLMCVASILCVISDTDFVQIGLGVHSES